MRLKLLVAGLLLSWVSTVAALQSVALTVGKITADNWELENVTLILVDIDQAQAQWALQSASLRLPPPLAGISGFNISCHRFQWRNNFLQCRQGQGHIVSGQLKSPTFDFSLSVQDQQGTIQLENLHLFGGFVSMTLQDHDGNWRIKTSGKNIELAGLQSVVKLPDLLNVSGRADLTAELLGSQDNLNAVFVEALLKQLTLQAGSQVASETAMLATEFKATKINKLWRWRNQLNLRRGAVYIEPVFLQAQPQQGITLSSDGDWWPESGEINLRSAELKQPQVGELKAVAMIDLHKDKLLQWGKLTAHIPELSRATPVYLTPFLEAGPFAEIGWEGQMEIGLTLTQNALSDLKLDFNGLNVNDPEQRFQVVGANGSLYWRPREADVSSIDWRQLKLKTIPVEAGHIEFITQGKQIALQHQADIPLLGGRLTIEKFSYVAAEHDDADVHFSGALDNLSLEQLSEALDWTPLSGEISGRIPSVTYSNKKLELDGKLTMQVFGGAITIKKLASSGLFSDFAQFYVDIDIDNLDLNAITRKFQFGYIEGRLTGYAHNVYLENWQPVSFYAWFGTPDDDVSRHRISQKAIENIASIGGGGAADAISRGFMRFFDNFGYDKLGFGCYLHNGICQMMGVAAADKGYYLIKGGGLPRIDVIGYNPRLDWNVLLQRLRRITTTDAAMIE